MTADQGIIFTVLAAMIGMFLWGRLRHDMTALAALSACVFTGLVPADQAFAGFGHPAVITVAAVLVLSRVLQSSGAVDILVHRLFPKHMGFQTSVFGISVLGAVLSAFMNNVGALALLMPAAVQTASRRDKPPGRILMPLAFGSILGGMITLVGTPPNLIVSAFRAKTPAAAGFAMFDFAPVGLAAAAAGLLFITLCGRFLIPARKRGGVEAFDTAAYLTEALISADSSLVGKTLKDVEALLAEIDAQVVGLIRDDVRVPAPNPRRYVRAGDILVIEADPEALAAALTKGGLGLVADVPTGKSAGPGSTPEAPAGKSALALLQSDDVVLMEMAVLPSSDWVGRSAAQIELRSRFAVNLLAVSRQGRRSTARLRIMRIQKGDVLLLQGAPDNLGEFAQQFGCVPLAERSLRLPDKKRAAAAAAIMAAAVALAALGASSAAMSFTLGVLVCAGLRLIPLRNLYAAVDWSVVVLLAALIPVAGAVASTGAADLAARSLLSGIGAADPIWAVAMILAVTMTLSDFMNNAATAAIMCPVALGIATQLGASPDPFLMAAAVGASCAFLTPIGHQNNTLILGPSGFRFGDYWRLGLPLEIILVMVAVPVITWVWPLFPG